MPEASKESVSIQSSVLEFQLFWLIFCVLLRHLVAEYLIFTWLFQTEMWTESAAFQSEILV